MLTPPLHIYNAISLNSHLGLLFIDMALPKEPPSSEPNNLV